MSDLLSVPVNDMNVHLSFHLVNDITYNSQKKAIEAMMRDLFAETFSLEYEDPSENPDKEVIFKLQKPVMLDVQAHREFFEKLLTLFTDTQRYLPSFTQGLEAQQ